MGHALLPDENTCMHGCCLCSASQHGSIGREVVGLMSVSNAHYTANVAAALCTQQSYVPTGTTRCFVMHSPHKAQKCSFIIAAQCGLLPRSPTDCSTKPHPVRSYSVGLQSERSVFNIWCSAPPMYVYNSTWARYDSETGVTSRCSSSADCQ